MIPRIDNSTNVKEACSTEACGSGLAPGTFDTSAGACGGRLQKKRQLVWLKNFAVRGDFEQAQHEDSRLLSDSLKDHGPTTIT